MRKNWTKMLMALVLAATMLLTGTLTASAADAEVGDFTIRATDGSSELTADTDYVYKNGVLTVTTTTPVTIGMRSGVTTTAEIIVVDGTNGAASVTFDGIAINTTEDDAISVKGTNQVTLSFTNASSLTAADDAIVAKSTVPLILTSTDNGSLSISDTKYGTYLDGSTEGGGVTINGNIKLDISNADISKSYGIYLKNVGDLVISGSPVISIDTYSPALDAQNITISGGTLSLKNDKYRVIQAADGHTVTISGNADIHILEAAGGIDASEDEIEGDNGEEIIVPGKIIITGNAKVKMYGLDGQGNRIGGVSEYPLSASELTIDQNAVVDVYIDGNGYGICGDKTTITGNADVDLKIVPTTTSSRYAIRISDAPLEISGNATVDIDIDGAKVYGLYGTSETVNILGSAVVNIKGAYRGIYADYIHVSGNAKVNVSEDKNYAIYCDDGAFTISDSAAVTASSDNGAVNFYVKPKVITVTPAEGKVYAITQGDSANDPVTMYCTEKTDVSNSSSKKFFHAEVVDTVPVIITGTDKQIAYDSSTYDVAQLFTIDRNAGTATYSMDAANSTGAGTLDGTTLTITKAGRFIIKVETAANGAYAAGNGSAVLTVSKGTPAFPTGTTYTAVYGQTVSKIVPALPTGWSWAKPNDPVGDYGTQTHQAVFAETDVWTANTADVNVTVGQSESTLTADSDKDAYTYGETVTIEAVLAQLQQTFNLLRAFTPAASGQMAVYNGSTQLTAAQNAKYGETLTFTLDTEADGLTPGSYTLTVKFVESDNMAEASADVSFTVSWLDLTNIPDPTLPDGSTGSGEGQDGDGWFSGDVTITAPDGYEISTDGGETWGPTGTIDTSGSPDGENTYDYLLQDTQTGEIGTGNITIQTDNSDPVVTTPTVNSTDTTATITVPATDASSGIAGSTLTQTGGEPAVTITDNGNGTFSITGMTPGETYTFDLTVTDNAGNTTTITGITVTASAAVAIVWPTEDQIVTVYEGEQAEMSIVANNAFRYQWYINYNDGTGWHKKEGATSATYISSPTELDNSGFQYGCIAFGESGEVYAKSPIFTLEVLKVPVLPETGDDRPIGLWISLLALSLTGMLLMLRNGKRRYNH